MKSEFERRLSLWLADEAPREAPDRLLESIITTTAELQATPPRRPLGAWFAQASAIGLATVVIVTAIGVGLGVAGLLREDGSPSVPTPASIRPRPSNIPTDGTCEVDRQCLGLLDTGTYRSEYFHPPLSFRIHEVGWENLRSSGGMVTLIPLDAPGDELILLEQATPRTSENRLVTGIAHTPDAFVRWITGRQDLNVSEPTPASLGGLDGEWVDVTVRADAANGIGGCPARPCVALAYGTDPGELPTWIWELSAWRGSALRIYALDHRSSTVLVVVRSWDGSRLREVLARVGPILESLEFELASERAPS